MTQEPAKLADCSPYLIGGDQVARLGITLHAFAVRDSEAPSGAH